MPEIAFAYNYLGLVLEELEQVESAIEAYLKAIRLDPRFYAARENLGNARLKLEEEQYRQTSLQNWDSSFDADTEIPWEFDESQGTELPDSGDPLPGWIYLDEKSFLMVGWPGHRIRPGRSGYDPLDTSFEEAHTEGVIIRLLFTGKLRTQNPVYLFMMACLCILFCLPLLFIGGTRLQDNLVSIFVLLCYSPVWIFGIALWVNMFSSLVMQKPDASEDNGSAFF
jgi:tetratricopeptide (TPR) repeat protein